MWLAVASQDAQAAAGVVDELWERELEPEARERARRAAAGSAECPACGAALAEGATRCIQCGLRFG